MPIALSYSPYFLNETCFRWRGDEGDERWYESGQPPRGLVFNQPQGRVLK